MYLAIQSQPPGSMGKGKLRVTEQGEMVQAKFGTGNIALRQMEIVTTAVLKAGLSNPVVEQPKYREIMDKLSKISCEKYREKVCDNPMMITHTHIHPTCIHTYIQMSISHTDTQTHTQTHSHE